MISFFGGKKNETGFGGDPIAIEWAKTDAGKFHNLISIKEGELGIQGMGGVFVIWFSGIKTSTIYVGATEDLVASIKLAKDLPAVTAFHVKGGLGITWAPFADKYRNRVTSYLRQVMKPILASIPELDGSYAEEEPLPVTLPFSI